MTNEPTDLTTRVLVAIRAEVGNLNKRLDNHLRLAGEAAREHEEWLRDHDVRIKRLEGHPPRRRPDGPPRRR